MTPNIVISIIHLSLDVIDSFHHSDSVVVWFLFVNLEISHMVLKVREICHLFVADSFDCQEINVIYIGITIVIKVVGVNKLAISQFTSISKVI